MARYCSKDLVIEFGGVDISGNWRVLEIAEGMNTIDATAGDDDHETHLPDVKWGRADITLLADKGTAGTAVYTALAPGGTGELVYYPEGTASGKVKHSISSARVVERTHRLVYNAAVEIRASFELEAAEATSKIS